MAKNELVDIACRFIHETKLAVLVSIMTMNKKDEVEMWLPKSQVELERTSIGDVVTLPAWLAKERELI